MIDKMDIKESVDKQTAISQMARHEMLDMLYDANISRTERIKAIDHLLVMMRCFYKVTGIIETITNETPE